MTPDIFPAMSSDVQWIKDALARDPTKTRAGIAEALGVDKSAVTRLLAGERQLKFHEADKIAAYLGAPGPAGLSDRARGFGAEGGPPGTAPVYRAEPAADGRWLLARHEPPIDWRPRAPHFLAAAKVFGLYAPDDIMAPRFMPGETVWVDPGRPARAGDDVLFVEKRRGRGPETALLALLESADDESYAVRQHRTGGKLKLDAAGWTALHVLARY